MEKINKDKKEELVLSLMNILAAEEHMLDEPENFDFHILKNIREIRDSILMLLFTGNKNIFAKWCVLKHMLLAYEHILESIPKNNEINIKISLKNISKKIKENIEIILEQIEYGDFKECKICSNDLVKFVETIKSNIKKQGGN